MELTPSESKVMHRLRRLRVATMETLRRDLDVSHMTVVRACQKYGYFSSINRNASFYTLRDTPDFDPDGLWTYRGICFSRHRTLEKTLVALVHDSPAGLTVAELEARLHTRVGNLLSRLCRRKAVDRGAHGRQAVYLASDGPRQRQQRATRERLREEGAQRATAVAPVATPRDSFPPRLEVVVVLEVLLQCIKTPRADAAAVARRLRAAGRKITAVQVQRVFAFYDLKKKRHTGRRGAGSATGSRTDR
jgi:hypothetical protein